MFICNESSLLEALKALFWREIVPNIKTYDRLTPEKLEYFDLDNMFFDKNLSTTICQNETHNSDYQLCKSSLFEHLKPQEDLETFDRVEESFRRPNKCQGLFGYESDPETEEEFVKIRQDKPPLEDECDAVEQNLMMAFNAFLRRSGEDALTADDVHTRLADLNTLSSLDDVTTFSLGAKEFVQQMKFFESTIVLDEPSILTMSRESSIASSLGNQSSGKENSLDVPEDSSFNQSGGDGSQKRMTRSRSRVSLQGPQRAPLGTRQSASGIVPAQTVQVPPPHTAMQPRMKNFMSGFGAAKRRRMSTSPVTNKSISK